jgi:hypothetical protein
MKTTNAKAKAFQTPAGPAPEKELEKTQRQQTSTRKPKKVIHADTVKLEVHGDDSPLAERDVEYCPPKPKDLPYESDTFPNGCLDYSQLKGKNLINSIYNTYRNQQLDENGLTKQERDDEAAYLETIRKGDEAVLKMMEEEWTIGDVPETFRHIRKKSSPEMKLKIEQPVKKAPKVESKGPATIISRRAASALSVAPKSGPLLSKPSNPAPKPSFLSRSKPAPVSANPSNASTMRHAAATATSRSTIGYTKGRTALDALSTQSHRTVRSGLARSVSTMSTSSDTTITPARFAEQGNEQEWRHPSFLKAFEVDDEDLEPGLRGVLPDCLRQTDEDDEEFVMTLG